MSKNRKEKIEFLWWSQERCSNMLPGNFLSVCERFGKTILHVLSHVLSVSLCARRKISLLRVVFMSLRSSTCAGE